MEVENPTGTANMVFQSLKRLESWVLENEYRGYEPFDGLSTPLRSLTFGNLFLDRLLLQAVRRSPVNLRPILGIKPLESTKGRGYMAWGFLAMLRATRDRSYEEKAVTCLDWLMRNKSPKFTEYSWANHFDFASRGGRYSKDESIIVWTALIGQAFLDGYQLLGNERYLSVAQSICQWILKLPRKKTESGTCLGYNMLGRAYLHNSNMLGAALLARTARLTDCTQCMEIAKMAVEYSCSRQRADGSWYGEDPKYQWIDSFHTGYDLDSLKCYSQSSGDRDYDVNLRAGLNFFIENFFEPDGMPKYYHNRTYPVDSQCVAQAIETLANFSEYEPRSLELGRRVARWAIDNMQDEAGFFYFRVYRLFKNKIPMLHWSQATSYRALACLFESLSKEDSG